MAPWKGAAGEDIHEPPAMPGQVILDRPRTRLVLGWPPRPP